jgi:hypothetical protein
MAEPTGLASLQPFRTGDVGMAVSRFDYRGQECKFVNAWANEDASATHVTIQIWTISLQSNLSL